MLIAVVDLFLTSNTHSFSLPSDFDCVYNWKGWTFYPFYQFSRHTRSFILPIHSNWIYFRLVEDIQHKRQKSLFLSFWYHSLYPCQLQEMIWNSDSPIEAGKVSKTSKNRISSFDEVDALAHTQQITHNFVLLHLRKKTTSSCRRVGGWWMELHQLLFRVFWKTGWLALFLDLF